MSESEGWALDICTAMPSHFLPSVWYYPIKACMVVTLQIVSYIFIVPVAFSNLRFSSALQIMALACMSLISLRVVRDCRECLDRSLASMNELLQSDPCVLSAAETVLEKSYTMHMRSRGNVPTQMGLHNWSRSRTRAVRTLVFGVAKGLAHGVITRSQGVTILRDTVTILAYSQPHPARMGRDVWGA